MNLNRTLAVVFTGVLLALVPAAMVAPVCGLLGVWVTVIVGTLARRG